MLLFAHGSVEPTFELVSKNLIQTCKHDLSCYKWSTKPYQSHCNNYLPHGYSYLTEDTYFQFLRPWNWWVFVVSAIFLTWWVKLFPPELLERVLEYLERLRIELLLATEKWSEVEYWLDLASCLLSVFKASNTIALFRVSLDRFNCKVCSFNHSS